VSFGTRDSFDQRAGLVSLTGRDLQFVTNGGRGIAVDSASVSLIRCSFVGNGGGALSVVNGQNVLLPLTRIYNSVFVGHSMTQDLATVEVKDSGLVLANSLFAGNDAPSAGALWVAREWMIFPVTVVHSTIVQNSAGDLGCAGGICNIGANVKVFGSILRGNTARGVSSEIVDQDSATNVVETTYSNVSGLGTGTGNIDQNPLFVNLAGPDGILGTLDDDPTLATNSPSVDAGSTSYLPPDVADLDGDGSRTERIPVDLLGNPRVVGATPDQGAVETPAQ